jgi:hypothetical protein
MGFDVVNRMRRLARALALGGGLFAAFAGFSGFEPADLGGVAQARPASSAARPHIRPHVTRPNRPGAGRPGLSHRPGNHRPGHHRPGHHRPGRPIRPVPGRRPFYWGRVLGGVTVGAIIAASLAPPPPDPALCWFWTDHTRTHGYWDYCVPPTY